MHLNREVKSKNLKLFDICYTDFPFTVTSCLTSSKTNGWNTRFDKYIFTYQQEAEANERDGLLWVHTKVNEKTSNDG